MGLFASVVLALAILPAMQAEIRLPAPISDHMILQRDVPARIWGWAEPGGTIQVGDVSQTVTVSGGTPLLEVTNASIGRVVEQKELTEMPVAQTNPINLANLAPGVISENFSNTTGVTGNGGNSEYRTMGGMGYNEYTLDGLPIKATVGQPGFTPSSA